MLFNIIEKNPEDFQKCGIYLIENLITNKKYVGQSVNIYKRWRSHITSSRNKDDVSFQYPLNRAFRKYGIHNFDFAILKECSVEDLNSFEYKYIKKYDCIKNGYNQMDYFSENKPFNVLTKESLKNLLKDLEESTILKADLINKYNINRQSLNCVNRGDAYYGVFTEDYPVRRVSENKIRNNIYRKLESLSEKDIYKYLSDLHLFETTHLKLTSEYLHNKRGFILNKEGKLVHYNDIIKLFNQGFAKKETLEKLSISRNACKTLFRAHNITLREEPKTKNMSIEEVLNDLETLSFVSTAKKYNISDNAVRKFLIKHGCSPKASDYKNDKEYVAI